MITAWRALKPVNCNVLARPFLPRATYSTCTVHPVLNVSNFGRDFIAQLAVRLPILFFLAFPSLTFVNDPLPRATAANLLTPEQRNRDWALNTQRLPLKLERFNFFRCIASSQCDNVYSRITQSILRHFANSKNCPIFSMSHESCSVRPTSIHFIFRRLNSFTVCKFSIIFSGFEVGARHAEVDLPHLPQLLPRTRTHGHRVQWIHERVLLSVG